MEEYEENDLGELKRKAVNKCGGFQSMGLSFPVLKGVLKRGYKIPTPIQRKTIPLALEGRDIVAMARTGSGKTACFLLPLFEKLKTRQSKLGARGLILSPTRELALQTLKFIKELGKFTGLQASVIIGGDSMDTQFSIMHTNPDIVVATPGRFLHICIEMDLKLESIEFVIFDEADRLFEMGFGEQIHEIVSRLPANRQTLLFSATLPKLLVEFTKAGLSDPVLLRLDVESKLPDSLELVYITCRSEEKLAVLLSLLKDVIKNYSQTVIFAATMHHVEYIHMILDKAGISNTYIYSNLDPSARKINAAKFQKKKVNVLVVTDVAARGIDIPHLDNVINYHFPAKSKLFVHRVGRCARAGRAGTAYNIVCADEYAYLLDLHLFLGQPFNIVPKKSNNEIVDKAIGKIPQSMIEEWLSELIRWQNDSFDIANMKKVCENGYQQYIRSRPPASMDSNNRVKELNISNAGILPLFHNKEDAAEDILSSMKNYRPPGTVFEIVAKPSSHDYKVMKEKRALHKQNIMSFHKKIDEKQKTFEECKEMSNKTSKLPSSTTEEIDAAFSEIIFSKKRKIENLYKSKKNKKQMTSKDGEFYIPYAAPDKKTEEGLAVNNYATDAEKAQVDLIADSEDSRRLQSQIKRWDRKKKKMITLDNNSKVGKILTESGVWIPATYKSNRYSQWKEKSKIEARNDKEDNDNIGESQKVTKVLKTRWLRFNEKMQAKNKVKSELRKPEEILKVRKLQEKKKARNGRKKKNTSHRGQNRKGSRR